MIACCADDTLGILSFSLCCLADQTLPLGRDASSSF
jgi:hypothetical protein